MNLKLNKLRVLLQTQFAYMTAYRAEIVLWILLGILPLLMMSVWITQANRSASGSLQGYNAGAFASYFLAVWVSTQLIVVWVAWELDNNIRYGILSSKLLRPIDPFWEFLASHIGEKMVRFPFLLLIATLGLLVIPGASFSTHPLNWLIYILSISLSFLIRFLMSYCIGMLAFWSEQVIAIEELYWSIYGILSGLYAPLEFYPQAVRSILEWTPFPYLIYFPARVLSGKVNNSEIGWALLIQLVWLGLFALLRLILWRAGLKRYSAVGA
ncbi:MAG: ABC-2 family transporter protein [Acidobacteriota bacterium]